MPGKQSGELPGDGVRPAGRGAACGKGSGRHAAGGNAAVGAVDSPMASPGDHGRSVGWGARRPSSPHPPGLQAALLPLLQVSVPRPWPPLHGAAGGAPSSRSQGPRPPPALCPLGCLPWGASLGSEEQTQPVLGPPASGSCPTPSGRGRSHQLAGPCPVSLTLLSSKDQGWVGLGGGPLPRVWASRSPPGAPVVGGEVGHTFFQGTHSAAGPPARPSISPPPQAQCGPHTESHSSLPEAPGDTAASLPGHAARRGWGRGEAGSC